MLQNLSIAAPPTTPDFDAKHYSNLSALPKDQLMEKARELESVFLNTLMSEMNNSLDSRGDFGGGYAEETWRGMQGEQYAKLIADNGGIGLADQIAANLLAAQEQYHPSFGPMPLNGAYKQ